MYIYFLLNVYVYKIVGVVFVNAYIWLRVDMRTGVSVLRRKNTEIRK